MTTGVIRHIAVILLIFLLTCLPAPLFAGPLDSIDHLTGKNDGVVVADSRGRIIFSKNAVRRLVPASILKIHTAMTALHYLTPSYHFPTEFYMDGNGDLTVKGYGDPLLLSEVLQEIAENLKERVRTVRNLLLDDSFFTDPLTIPGISESTEPYDAPNGALCANFNTVSFRRQNGVYVSAEPQTPLLPFALPKIEKTGLKGGRITLSHQHHETTRYAGLLLRYFLESSGIPVTGTVMRTTGQKPGASLVYTYISPYTLVDVIEKLLEYSNNFMANQILIAAGARAFGTRGNLEKGVRAAKQYASGILGIDDMQIAEGSGISRKNRVSPENMLKILDAFRPYRHLMRRTGNDLFKTGRLKGVRTRAGYIEGKSGTLYRYVVMINTPGHAIGPVMKVLLENLE